MAVDGLPGLDVARVQRWCVVQVPEHVRNKVRVKCDVAPRYHYTKATGLWTLYWRDRHQKYHRYEPLDPSPQVQDLLDYLDGRADPILWG